MKKLVVALMTVILIAGLGFSFKKKIAFSDSNKIEQVFETKAITKINVKNESWNIKISESTSGKIEIEADGKDNNSVKIKQEAEQVSVTQKDKSSGILGSLSFGEKGTISIKIPKNKLDKLTVNNDSGDLTISKVVLEKLVVNNDSGFGKVSNISVGKGKFNVKEGELSFKSSKFQDLKVASTSGDISLESIFGNKITTLSDDGEITISKAIEGRELKAESESGDINIFYKKVPTSLTVITKTNSNDNTVSLTGFKAKTDNEKQKIGTIGSGENNLVVKSNKGTVTIK